MSDALKVLSEIEYELSQIHKVMIDSGANETSMRVIKTEMDKKFSLIRKSLEMFEEHKRVINKLGSAVVGLPLDEEE